MVLMACFGNCFRPREGKRWSRTSIPSPEAVTKLLASFRPREGKRWSRTTAGDSCCDCFWICNVSVPVRGKGGLGRVEESLLRKEVQRVSVPVRGKGGLGRISSLGHFHPANSVSVPVRGKGGLGRN